MICISSSLSQKELKDLRKKVGLVFNFQKVNSLLTVVKRCRIWALKNFGVDQESAESIAEGEIALSRSF